MEILLHMTDETAPIFSHKTEHTIQKRTGRNQLTPTPGVINAHRHNLNRLQCPQDDTKNRSSKASRELNHQGIWLLNIVLHC